MKMLMMIVLGACVFSTGCRSPSNTKVKSDLVPEKAPEELPRLYNMVKDSDLYCPPAVPADLSPEEQKDYLHGYRLGWEDQGEEWQFDIDMTKYMIPASLTMIGQTELFKKAYHLGREQAIKDFEVFKTQMMARTKRN